MSPLYSGPCSSCAWRNAAIDGASICSKVTRRAHGACAVLLMVSRRILCWRAGQFRQSHSKLSPRDAFGGAPWNPEAECDGERTSCPHSPRRVRPIASVAKRVVCRCGPVSRSHWQRGLRRSDPSRESALDRRVCSGRPGGMTCARRLAGAQRPACSAGSPRKPDPRPCRRRAREKIRSVLIYISAQPFPYIRPASWKRSPTGVQGFARVPS